MRTYTHSSSTTQIAITYPEKRAFAFSPNILIVTLASAYSETAEVTLTMNGYTQKRNCINRTCTFILDALFQSYFKGTVLDTFTDYTPTMVLDKTIVVKATHGTTEETVTLNGATYATDIIWGALQFGEVEPTTETIYRFGTLPLTITQTIGDNWKDGPNTYSGSANYGKTIDIQTLTEDGYPTTIILLDDVTTKKTYTIQHSDCTRGVYFRWIDEFGEYKYYLLQQASDETSSKNGNSFNHFHNVATNGYTKNRSQLISKTVGKSIRCGVQSADDTLTEFLRGCQGSIKHWIYENSKWVEVILEDSSIQTLRLEGGRQIDFKFRYSDKYTASL